MKKIIVPTNFTAKSDKVLRYAIELANQFESTIYLVHVYQKDSPLQQTVTRREAMDKLEQTASMLERELYFTTFVKTVILDGQVVNQLSTYSKKIEADLIVMGGANSWRATGMNTIFSEAIRRSRTSILLVPDNYRFKAVSSISLAIDKKVAIDDPEIAPLVTLAEGLHSIVKVLEVAKTPVLTCVEAGYEGQNSQIQYGSYHVQHDDINGGIQNFVGESNIDILAFINREYGLSGRFFNNLATKKTSTDAPLVPLLMLHRKQEKYSIKEQLN